MPKINPMDDMMRVALNAVRRASSVARSIQQQQTEIGRLTKDDRSPVTVADFAVQAIIATILRESFEDVFIVGEEHADILRNAVNAPVRHAVVAAVQESLPKILEQDVLSAIDSCNHDGTGKVYWALDPVDGTKGFVRGQQYAIALARIESGCITHAVMGCPNLPVDHHADVSLPDPNGVIYTAENGCGAKAYFADTAANDADDILTRTSERDNEICVCESVEAAHSRHEFVQQIIDILGRPAQSIRLDSQCKYALVARGQADMYLRMPTKKGYVEKIWDHAAGSLIATEAGAIVTDIVGKPLDFTHGRTLKSNRGIVCASKCWHSRIINAINQIGIAVSC